jgi:hypothetical protein
MLRLREDPATSAGFGCLWIFLKHRQLHETPELKGSFVVWYLTFPSVLKIATWFVGFI